MKIAFIGDIVGRSGRMMIAQHLRALRQEYGIDCVIANAENASHGFGLTLKNAQELLKSGVDVMSGGNHTWDKKEIITFIDTLPILRPHNYPPSVAGSGCRVFDIGEEKLAVVNLMGHYGMPYVDNMFRCAQSTVESLHEQGIQHIFIDVHAEATSEKRALMMLLQGKVSGIVGTHTHVSTDDLQIVDGTAYLSDIGLTGCRDNVIGMAQEGALERFMSGISSRLEVDVACKKILQIVILELEEGRCVEAWKLKIFDDGRILRSDAWHETL